MVTTQLHNFFLPLRVRFSCDLILSSKRKQTAHDILKVGMISFCNSDLIKVLAQMIPLGHQSFMPRFSGHFLGH